MCKSFKCSKCGSGKFSMITEVITYNDVDYDESGNTIYTVDEDRQYEKFSCYICSQCSGYLTNNGVVVGNEAELEKYLEKYGVGKGAINV
jgi:hypothetical protein